jgi:hypothetical protein
MFRWQRFNIVLAVYSLLASVSAFITGCALFLIPSDPKNHVFLGLSLQRLAMFGGLFFAGNLLAFWAVKAYSDVHWAERVWAFLFGNKTVARGLRWGATVALVMGLMFFAVPSYQFGDSLDYFVRVTPLVVWLTFVSFLIATLAWVEKYGLHWSHFVDTLRAQKKILGVALISMTVFILIWIVIAKTGMGLWVTDGFWYGAGVPILGLQILIAFAMGLGVLFLERSTLKVFPAWSDALIFFLLWGITAFLWAREPVRSSFFAPGPYPPDNLYHPYSDAALFDVGSQFALIGQGINNGLFFDRALYMAFLVFLHAIAKQDYVQIVALQAAIYAVFPAVIYLLGKEIHSRPFGFILAVLILLRGINGIAAGSMINLANQKQMLTDFPTVIFVSGFALLMVKWLKAPGKKYLYLLWAGGLIGFGIMVRTNMLFMLFLIAPLMGVIYWRKKLQAVLIGFLLLLTMFASTFAWGFYNGKSVFDVYIYRILLVIDARYPHPAPTDQAVLQASEDTSLALTGEVVPVSYQPVSLKSNLIRMSSPSKRIVTDSAKYEEIKPIPVFVTIHFLHNVITSVLIFPVDIKFDDLRHTLKYGEPFWDSYWDGSLTFSTASFLTLNLLLIALGIGLGWKSARLCGVVPLGVFVVYNFSNAFARTSGGRYLVPMDWVVLLYFALGLFQIILWGIALFGFKNKIVQAETDDKSWGWKPLKKAPLVVVLFLLLGASIPFSEQFFPRRYATQTPTQLIEFMEQKGYLQKIELDKSTLIDFASQTPDFRIVNGRALYPRFFLANEGIPKNRYPYGIMEFPRVAFTMIGPYGANFAILRQGEIPYFPDASDVIVLGCQADSYIDAIAIVVVADQTMVYTRQPALSLQCPLPRPICDENQICQ